MDKTTVSADDVIRVKNYMMFFHQGFVKARPRKLIAQSLGIEDRRFRDICAEIPEIITSHRFGYYILPLVDLTGIETRRARDILDGEDRRRIITLYLRMRRQRQAVKIMQNAEKQMELAI
jgi:hypothetical protein